MTGMNTGQIRRLKNELMRVKNFKDMLQEKGSENI